MSMIIEAAKAAAADVSLLTLDDRPIEQLLMRRHLQDSFIDGALYVLKNYRAVIAEIDARYAEEKTHA